MNSALETIDWHSFLARPPLPAPSPDEIAELAREPILITGAGGSIGSAVAQRLAAAGAPLILLESSEANLFDLRSAFEDSHRCTLYLGGVDDGNLLDDIFELHHPRLIFHAAAFKHVPLLEHQALAAISNNIFGTESLASFATAHKSHIILLSTDKAVDPTSVMGATKRAAEQIVLQMGGTVLRLGNVLASRGSVAEIFARQIGAWLPLTITGIAARRYFITISEAVDLLCAAAAEPEKAALFVPNLRSPHYIVDLASFMARTLAPDREIPMKFSHARAGEKECEELFSATEIAHSPRSNGLIPVDSPILSVSRLHSLLSQLKDAAEARELVPALSILGELVPNYEPSRAVLQGPLTFEPRLPNV